MDRNMLLLLGGGALVLWWMNRQQHPATTGTGTGAGTGTGTSTGTQPTTGTTSGGTTTGTSTATAAATDAIKQTIINSINTSGVSSTFTAGNQSADTWNWYAMRALPGWTAPAPEDLFPMRTDPHGPVSFEDWWAVARPFLASWVAAGGLHGLGMYGQVPAYDWQSVYGGWA
jgi:hypothetical protein